MTSFTTRVRVTHGRFSCEVVRARQEPDCKEWVVTSPTTGVAQDSWKVEGFDAALELAELLLTGVAEVAVLQGAASSRQSEMVAEANRRSGERP